MVGAGVALPTGQLQHMLQVVRKCARSELFGRKLLERARPPPWTAYRWGHEAVASHANFKPIAADCSPDTTTKRPVGSILKPRGCFSVGVLPR